MRIVELALAASLLAVPPVSYATITEIFGGPGGAPFSISCDHGEYLVGFRAHAGAWVDGIGILCAPMARDGSRLTGSFTRKGWAGGKGGALQEVYCPPGEALTKITAIHTRGGGLSRQYVNTIDIGCQHNEAIYGCIRSGEHCGAVPKPISARQVDDMRCPPSEYATGIQGRAGNYLDAIGLICARIAAPSAKAMPSPTLSPRPGEQKVEANVDRPGGDYRNFDLASASAQACKAACENDARCRTYSYVKPGVQGPKARCWLKNQIPRAQQNSCCVSGVIRTSAIQHRAGTARPVRADA